MYLKTTKANVNFDIRVHNLILSPFTIAVYVINSKAISLTFFVQNGTFDVPPPTPHAHLVGEPPVTSILLLGFPTMLWVMMTTLPPAPLPPGADL